MDYVRSLLLYPLPPGVTAMASVNSRLSVVSGGYVHSKQLRGSHLTATLHVFPDD